MRVQGHLLWLGVPLVRLLLAVDLLHHGCEHGHVFLLALLLDPIPLIDHVELELCHLLLEELPVAVVELRPLRLGEDQGPHLESPHLNQLIGEEVGGLVAEQGEERVRLQDLDQRLSLALLVMRPDEVEILRVKDGDLCWYICDAPRLYLVADAVVDGLATYDIALLILGEHLGLEDVIRVPLHEDHAIEEDHDFRLDEEDLALGVLFHPHELQKVPDVALRETTEEGSVLEGSDDELDLV